ncbi:hypothetical protein [Mesorhizobium koreense]|jgi:hypothetical protein|uniref:hypothetical protein n=1 Tax=Mesorhizobium koreense TaxID=3074855 RepID=UPI00287B643B|nr:hypothetical protein [Mesorhizobium sp. WR6]
MTTNRTASQKQWLGAGFVRGASRWLCLAASPTFALMALVTAVSEGHEMGCIMGQSPLAGMVPMYLLMSAFHLAPWLRLASGSFRPTG